MQLAAVLTCGIVSVVMLWLGVAGLVSGRRPSWSRGSHLDADAVRKQSRLTLFAGVVSGGAALTMSSRSSAIALAALVLAAGYLVVSLRDLSRRDRA